MHLTNRQEKAAELIASGHGAQGIADHFYITTKSAQDLIQAACAAADVPDQIGLGVFFIERYMLPSQRRDLQRRVRQALQLSDRSVHELQLLGALVDPKTRGEPLDRIAATNSDHAILRQLCEVSGARSLTHLAILYRLARQPNSPMDNMRPREKQCLAFAIRGLSNKEIGKRLGVSEDTVKTHMRRAFKCLKVGTRAEAAVCYVLLVSDEERNELRHRFGLS